MQVSAEINELIKYKSARFECKFTGSSRSNLTNKTRKRQTKTYRQGCSARFTISSKIKNGEYILSINSLVEEHDHQRSDGLFKVLPKQRQATLKKAEPFLKNVLPIKPNMMLLQNQICTNDADSGVVKRRDIYNLRNKMNATPSNKTTWKKWSTK